MNSPHDKLIKSVFANEENAIEFFSKQLPQELVQSFNMNSLKVEPGNFVDHNLKQYQSDLLFSIKTIDSKPVFIYILFEHKSYIDKNIHKQLLIYLGQIYKNQKSNVPVIPFVFYHGQSEWNVPLKFLDTFDLGLRKETLTQYILDFGYMLFDLTKSELMNLEFSLTIYACLSILQYIIKDGSDEALREILQYLREIHSDQNISDYASRFLTYLFEVKDIGPKETSPSLKFKETRYLMKNYT